MSFIPDFKDIGEEKNKVIQLLRMQGPMLPAEIGKAMKSNSIFAGALLSELASSKQVKISNAKIGGSPLYFLRGQEAKLDKLYDHLHEKERRTYDLLKEKQIIKDTDVGPVERTALREIKDFSVMLNVTIDNEKHIFWKWHLLSDEEAAQLIKRYMGLDNPKEKQPEKEEKQEEKKPEPGLEKPDEAKQEIKKTRSLETKKQTTEKTKLEREQIKLKSETQEKLSKKDVAIIDDDFYIQIKEYFQKNNIEINKTEVIRKNSDIEMIIEIPSTFGTLNYFCKAKNKKKCNDGDLSSAFIKAQSLKLPIIFLTTGEVTKKAQDMLNKEFKGMTLKNI